MNITQLVAENTRLKKLISVAQKHGIVSGKLEAATTPKQELAVRLRTAETKVEELQNRVYELEAVLRKIWHDAERASTVDIPESRHNRVEAA